MFETNISYADFRTWAMERETLTPTGNFWAYEDAYEKGYALLKGLDEYFEKYIFRKLIYNLGLHYIITTDYEYNGVQNPLYVKYEIATKGKGLIASASDATSSATRVITNAMQNLDYLGQDLVSTPYGKYVYEILSTINIAPVLL